MNSFCGCTLSEASHQQTLSSKQTPPEQFYHPTSWCSALSRKSDLFGIEKEKFPCQNVLFPAYRAPPAEQGMDSTLQEMSGFDWIKTVMTRKQSHTQSCKSSFPKAGSMPTFSQAWLTSLNINKQRLYCQLAQSIPMGIIRKLEEFRAIPKLTYLPSVVHRDIQFLTLY